jgi:ArsR family transcriptional regulator, virulence genes transcriptional regulator
MNIQDLTRNSVEASQLLSMLANPHRLLILCELHNGEKSVSSLEQIVDLSQSALSQHLAKLRAAAIVTTRRDAQTIYYSIADVRAARLLAVLYELFCKPNKRGNNIKRKTK